jgi:choloylglycine hydrolase
MTQENSPWLGRERTETVNLRIALFLAIGFGSVLFLRTTPTEACTGITLHAQDGSPVYGRTLEWGTFDLNSRLIVIPRGTAFQASTPDGKPGLQWKAKYGVAGIDVLEKDALADAMNEKGMVAGLFYHPGFASYTPYDPARAAKSMGPTDVMSYILTSFATLDEVRKGMVAVDVVPVVEPALGFPAPIHVIVTDPSGKAIVLEWYEGKLRIFDAPLGVVTNAPTYDWHMTNLRNYLNLSPVALPAQKIEDLDFTPLGGGSGMIGLPGDFTPVSRFVRAVAYTQTARPTEDGPETVYEVLRILDNFNVPLGAAEGGGDEDAHGGMEGLRSSTLWTSVWDIRNKDLYYHTQHNRRVRRFDLDQVDWEELRGEIVRLPLDREKVQDVEQIEMPVR